MEILAVFGWNKDQQVGFFFFCTGLIVSLFQGWIFYYCLLFVRKLRYTPFLRILDLESLFKLSHFHHNYTLR